EPTATETVSHPAPASRRWGPWLIAVMLGLTLGLVGFLVFKGPGPGGEEQAYKEAKDLYAKGEFRPAGRAFKRLAEAFPNSERIGEYRFFADLCAVRAASKDIYDLFENPEVGNKAMEQLRAFINKYKDDPLFKQYIPDIWDTFVALIEMGLPEADLKV